MKNVFVVGLLLSSSLFAAYPFTISGDKIQAIFASELLWKKVGMGVESITYKGHTGKTSQYAVTTTERVPVIDARGVTIGSTPTPCLVVVDVTDTGDDFVPKWEVSKADFTSCPKTTFSK